MESRWDISSVNSSSTNPLIKFLDDSPKKDADFSGFEQKVPVKHETVALVEELNRTTSENKKLVENIIVLYKKYTTMQEQFNHLKTKNSEDDQINVQLKKRKANSEDYVNMINRKNGNTESSFIDEDSSKRPMECTRTKITRVYYDADASDASLVVKDGYQWRKYGEKVTRDNPFPRAYFKCSFAPSCPIKKKVQRSAEDPSVLVATYEGEHNHLKPCQPGISLSTGQISNLVKIPNSIVPLRPLGPLVALGLIQDDNDAKKVVRGSKPEIQQISIEQMASSLTRDPNFTAAIAAAISETVLSHTLL